MPGACGFVCGTLPHSKLLCTPSLPSPQLVGGGSQLALPLSFRRASPQLLALFLACVWAEVSLRSLLLVALWHSGGACSLQIVKMVQLLAVPVLCVGRGWARLILCALILNWHCCGS